MMQQPNSFTSYALSPEEKQEAVKLNIVQKCYLQTLHADTAEMLLGLLFDPANPHVFTQQEAYYRGQIELLNFLLLQNSEAERKTLEKMRDEQAQKLRQPDIRSSGDAE